MRMCRIRMFLVCLLIAMSATAMAQQSDSLKRASDLAKQGLSLVDKGSLEKAMECFKQGALLDPQNSRFQYEMAGNLLFKK